MKKLDLVHFPVVFFQALINSMLPFLLIILITLFWLFYALLKKMDISSIKEKLISTSIITIFTLQPSIINYLFSMISCREIDKNYIQSFLTVECFNEDHYSWILKLFVPSFCFYGILLPLAAFLYMKYYECYLHETKHVKLVGFLSNGYRRKKYYWEFYFFYRKIAIIFITEFFIWKVESKALLILLILFFSLWQQSRDNPFITEDLNSLSFKATLFSFCTLFSGLFSYDFINTPSIAIIFMILVFLLNFYFVLYWIRRMLVLNKDIFYKPQLKRLFFWFIPYLNKLQIEFDPIQREAFLALAYFSLKNHQPEIKKTQKTSIFRSFKTNFSRLTNYQKPINLNKAFTLTKTIGKDAINGEVLNTQQSIEKEYHQPAKSLTEFEGGKRLSRKVNFQVKKIINEKRSSSSREKFIQELQVINSDSFRQINEKPNTFDILGEKVKLEEENKFLKEIIRMKDEHLKGLYEEIRQLNKDLGLQKQELELLAQNVSKNKSKPNKIKKINSFLTKHHDNSQEDNEEKGYFVEQVNVNEQKFKESFLMNKPFEVITPLFSLILDRKQTNINRNFGLIIKMSVVYMNLQNGSKLENILLRTSKNLLLNQRNYQPNDEKNHFISFFIEKIIRLQEKASAFLTIETFLSVPGVQNLKKIEIILPFPDCVFLSAILQNAETPDISLNEEVKEEKLISSQFSMKNPVRDIQKLFPSLGFQQEKLIGILSFLIEGTENMPILLEIHKNNDEDSLTIELFLLKKKANFEESFLKSFSDWLHKSFLEGFLLKTISLYFPITFCLKI